MKLVCAALIAGFATSALAGDSQPRRGCYERAYDAAHLAAHKGQIVDRAWLEIEARKDTPPYPFLGTLQFSVKGGSFSTFGACKEDGGGLLCNASLSAEEKDRCKRKHDGVRHCRIGYLNAGAFRIAASPEGVLVTISERLEMPGGNEEYLYLSPGNVENHAFLLKSAPDSACQ